MFLINDRFNGPIDDPVHLLPGRLEEYDTDKCQDHEGNFHYPDVLEALSEPCLEGCN